MFAGVLGGLSLKEGVCGGGCRVGGGFVCLKFWVSVWWSRCLWVLTCAQCSGICVCDVCNRCRKGWWGCVSRHRVYMQNIRVSG